MITDVRTYADERHALGDRLMMEYAGSLPPGQVLAAVARADLVVARMDPRDSQARMSLCESIARRSITDRIGLAIAGREARQRRTRAPAQG